jgi:3-hydroxybutyryl-CoA dehydrogenase
VRPDTLGVVGAGTMGAGIAQLGAGAGMRTLLHDPLEEALERGSLAARHGLAKWVEKGLATDGAAGLLEPVAALEELASCELVIEAAPERPDLKRELFARLSEVCGKETVLGTNTSSIPVTSLAGAAARPENVVGMHFFNPPPLMRLLEVIRADQTGERAFEMARATGEAMGKEVIVAADGPGFLVNRCGRPFSGEGLRLLQERVATHEQIDRICRLGGGFRMGPFELMDLVGIDVGFEVAKSFTELSFGEPRWHPSPLQARMVAAGRLGRKTGRGWYEYAEDGSYRPPDPESLECSNARPDPVAVLGQGVVAEALRECARGAGLELREGAPAELVVDAGFHLLPPVDESRLVELTRLPTTPDFAVDAAEGFFAGLGFACEWVGDAPGLVLGRIVAQLVNEAAFAIGEVVGSARDVDTGLELGLSHPRGPVAWSEAIGLPHVLAILDGLWDERREERYRAAPLLRRAALLGRSLS